MPPQRTPIRADTVIFDLSKPIENPPSFNWLFRGPRQADGEVPARREDGAHQALWEPLFLLNYATGKLDPWLGETIVSNPGHDVWTLTLRKGVTWSDGKPFTAADVIFTVRMARDERLNLPGEALEAGAIRRQVKDVGRPNPPDPQDLTVIFTLNEPAPRFALEAFGGAMFGSFLVMPAHVWADIMDPAKVRDPAAFAPNPIGTGPYVFNRQETRPDRVVWDLNPDWWGAKAGFKPLPRPRRLVWTYVASEGASRAMLQAQDNGLDAARPYGLAAFDAARKANGRIVGWDPDGPLAWNDPCARQLDVNLQHAVGEPPAPGPWSDADLRKGLSLLLDRAALAREAYGGATLPSRTIFPEYGAMRPFIDAVVGAGYGVAPTADPAGAAAAFARAGYARGADGKLAKGGKPLTATILVDRSVTADAAGAEGVARQMIAAGIDAHVDAEPHDEFWGRSVPRGDYEMVYGWLACGSVAEPYMLSSVEI